MVAASMAHMKVKESNTEKGMKKWRKILVIAETSTKLRNGVVVRERIYYKGHYHVQKPRTFWKGRAVSELTLTPHRRTLIESGHELILGHSP